MRHSVRWTVVMVVCARVYVCMHVDGLFVGADRKRRARCAYLQQHSVRYNWWYVCDSMYDWLTIRMLVWGVLCLNTNKHTYMQTYLLYANISITLLLVTTVCCPAFPAAPFNVMLMSRQRCVVVAVSFACAYNGILCGNYPFSVWQPYLHAPQKTEICK